MMNDLALRMWRVTFTDGTEFVTWAKLWTDAEALAKKEYTKSEIEHVWQDCGEESHVGLYTEERDLNELRARIKELEAEVKALKTPYDGGWRES
jgi:polyhydroxyalkanoate synthesis regulator phasin